MRLVEAIKKSKRVFICGNGGSAANAIHIANDLISVGVKAHALTGDIATLTAIGNDFGYDRVFSKQISVLADSGDLLIALSGSGNSPNICLVIETAKCIGVYSILVTGAYNPDPKAAEFANEVIRFGADMQAAEEMQLWLGHEAMRQLRGRA